MSKDKSQVPSPLIEGKNYLVLDDRYLLGEQIGSTGCYQLFKSFDIYENHRQLTIKKLSSRGGEESKRFEKEFEILANINYPHLLQAYDYLEHGNSQYILFEFVEGFSFDELLQQEKKLSLPELLAVAHKVTRALELLHMTQTLHLGITPGNIIVHPEEGTVKLLSLGEQIDLVKDKDELGQREDLNYFLPYLSPELVNKSPLEQSDIFSLCATLYQIFLWKRHSPFYSENAFSTILKIESYQPPSLLEQIQKEFPEDLSSAEEKLWGEISTIIAGGLEKDPEKRTKSASELASSFQKLQKKSLSIGHLKKSVAHKKLLAPCEKIGRKLQLDLKKLKAGEKITEESLRQFKVTPVRNRSFAMGFLALALVISAILFFLSSQNNLNKLIQEFRDLNTEKRIASIQEIGEIASENPEAIRFLIPALNDENEKVKNIALQYIEKIGDKSTSAFVQFLRDENSWEKRYNVVSILGEIGKKQPFVIPILAEALQDPDTIIRWKASDTFSLVPYTEEVISHLDKLLQDEREYVRLHATHTLANLGPRAVSVITQLNKILAEDPSEEVKQAIISALGEMGTEAIPTIISALSNQSETIKQKSTTILGEMGEKAIPALKEGLGDEDWAVRYNIVSALAEISQKSSKAIPALVEAIKDSDRIVRWNAAEAFSGVKKQPDEAVKALLELFDDPEIYVRLYALYALKNMGESAQSSLPSLQKLVKEDENGILTEAAVEAITKINGG